MPIVHRTHDPARPATAPRVLPPGQEAAPPAPVRQLVTPTRPNRAWPATVMVLALLVFTMFWAQTTLLIALIAALATAVTGGFLFALMFGTGWITQRRRRVPVLPRYR